MLAIIMYQVTWRTAAVIVLIALLRNRCCTAQQIDTSNLPQLNNTQPQEALKLQDCADVPVSAKQRELAANAAIVVTGITLAAGPGAGRCDSDTGNLNIALDNSTNPETNFIVMGVQCVHKGLLSCRTNEEDTKDCLILVAAPSLQNSIPCSLAQGERYQFYLQQHTNGCPGYYIVSYQHIYHSVRRPLGGTGCSFYPEFPEPNDLQTSLASTCTEPASCPSNLCDPLVTRSPCANDTSVSCTMKTCPGKWMYHNAIMPEDTCYEVYSYTTSGIPTNCYGRRYINNRIRQLAGQDPGLLGNATDPLDMTNSTTSSAVNAFDASQQPAADQGKQTVALTRETAASNITGTDTSSRTGTTPSTTAPKPDTNPLTNNATYPPDMTNSTSSSVGNISDVSQQPATDQGNQTLALTSETAASNTTGTDTHPQTGATLSKTAPNPGTNPVAVATPSQSATADQTAFTDQPEDNKPVTVTVYMNGAGDDQAAPVDVANDPNHIISISHANMSLADLQQIAGQLKGL